MLQIDMRKRIYSSDSERQKAYRLRKEEKGGRFVRVFVPKEIESRIKGKPGLLVERFIQYESYKAENERCKTAVKRLSIEKDALENNNEVLMQNIKSHAKANDKLRQENQELQNRIKALEMRIEKKVNSHKLL
jgi:FtsZ-binding cell division protein ZapB